MTYESERAAAATKSKRIAYIVTIAAFAVGVMFGTMLDDYFVIAIVVIICFVFGYIIGREDLI